MSAEQEQFHESYDVNDFTVRKSYDNSLDGEDEYEEEDDVDLTTQIVSNFWQLLFPSIEAIPLSTFITLSFFSAWPCVAYIVSFTKMGYGLGIFYYLSEHYEQYSYILGCSIAFFLGLLYVLDCQYWTSCSGIFIRKFCMLLVVIAAVVLILSTAAQYPYGPISMFLVATTIWMVIIRNVLYTDVDTKIYVSWLGGPFLFISFLVAGSWIAWICWKEKNEWNVLNNVEEADQAGCEPNFEDYPECRDPIDPESVCFIELDTGDLTATFIFPAGCATYCLDVFESCANTFILWAGPFLVSISMFCLSFFASFLRGGTDPEQEMSKFAKIWLLLLFGTWVSASLAGAGVGVSSTLAALTAAAFMASAVFLAASFNKLEREEQLKALWKKILDNYGSMLDVARGLLVVTCAPIFLGYLVLSVIIQFRRSYFCCECGSLPIETESMDDVLGEGILTTEARLLVKEFQRWDRTKVFTFAIYWGMAFMVLSVIVSQFTLLFLSWLIEQTSPMPLGTVTGILVGVGMIMFLLPPVPGVPIYLTLGIVIIPVGRDSLGIVWSMAYAMGVSLALKLIACTLQQKLIGGFFKDYVSVRQFVGINTTLIRAMRLVLAEPGMGIAKVCILVGGPDWPTSVLCGIMDLALFPVLFGTLPIVVLILPTMLTGSFTYLSGLKLEDGTYEFEWASTLATVSAAVTGLIQFVSMVSAAYYLEQTVTNRKEELEAIPIDEEVKIEDDKLEDVKKAYEGVTQWERVPGWARFTLHVSLACIIVSCYLVQLFSSRCFAEFQLTYTITEHLDGDWKNLVLPLGLVSMILFFASWAFLYIFTNWAWGKASESVKLQQET